MGGGAVRKTILIIALAAAHFVLSHIIVALTMQLGMFAAGSGRGAGFLGHLLVALTRVLYFPVITLSLYSRQWFPGDWIFVPMLFNSLLWGCAAFCVLLYLERRRTGPR